MTHDELLKYCLLKKGAYTDFPFGPQFTVVKVKKKIFAQLFCLKEVPMLTVNADAMTNDFYRNLYPDAVTRGYHCPPVMQPYFNTINLEKSVPENELLPMIDLSYTYVTGKLPKKIQLELREES